jgi:hypothetical protein
MGDSRKHAAALGAATIGEVLTTAGYASVLAQLTAAQHIQLQTYLDALVIDPLVQQEANDALRKGTKIYGQIVYTDPEARRRADKVMRDYIPVHQLDDCVRLQLTPLLDSKALAPTSDNPDEADFLDKVRKTLEYRGVWLRLSPKMVRDTDDPSRWVKDPRHFEVWLSLGPRGDTIPTRTGRIDRQALLSTQVIGANYYEKVDQGPVQSALDREVRRLSSEIDDGMQLHIEIARIRREATIGVVEASDFLGGADFPSMDIWNGPHKILLRAMNLMNEGRIWGARTLLIVAAIAVRDAANLLHKYIDKSTSGAERSVKVLKVARTAGKVAEVGLVVTGVGALALSGSAGAGTVAVTESSVDALAEREVGRYLARNPDLASELNQVRLAPGPRGTILGNVKGGHSAGAGQGFSHW